MELGVCGGADGNGRVGGHNTPVHVTVCLDGADGLCLHNAQANWRASTALRSVDGDAEIIRTCFDMGRNRKCDGRTMQRCEIHRKGRKPEFSSLDNWHCRTFRRLLLTTPRCSRCHRCCRYLNQDRLSEGTPAAVIIGTERSRALTVVSEASNGVAEGGILFERVSDSLAGIGCCKI